MKVFIDNNVLIDFLLSREPFCGAATKVFGMCEQRMVEGVVSSLSIVNAAYV
ncbi:MAG: PIN domain-containing protein, partial [Paludibacteraceae bacterium]